MVLGFILDPKLCRSHLGVQTLLQQIQDKFQTMSDQIFGRIDDMSILIDNLEGNLTNFLMKEQKVKNKIAILQELKCANLH
uniref:Heat shock factor-binding protein 1 n=1 Tax=Canis lupus familiaris TaxID=9615 RepID=A0A8P0T019_CANLF